MLILPGIGRLPAAVGAAFVAANLAALPVPAVAQAPDVPASMTAGTEPLVGAASADSAIVATLMGFALEERRSAARSAGPWDLARAIAERQRLERELDILTRLRTAQEALIEWNRTLVAGGGTATALPRTLCPAAGPASICAALPATLGTGGEAIGGEP